MKAFSNRRYLYGAVLLFLLWLSATAQAAAPAPAQLSPQDTLELQRIAAYLNNIRTMTARFQQVASNGGQHRAAVGRASRPHALRV